MHDFRRLRPTSTSVLVAALALALAACDRRPAADPEYAAEIEAWQHRRIAGISSETGWLTVVGLAWLQPGANRFGSAPDNPVVLPESVPPVAGVLDLGPDGDVAVRMADGVTATLDGEPVAERVLASDHGKDGPDVLQIGTVTFYLIQRGDQVAVRIKDRDSEARRHFRGLEYFPIDPRYRVEGHLERYDEPRSIMIPSAQGPDQPMLVPGVVRFTLLGAEYSLEPLLTSPDDEDFFFIFRDGTSGRTTYGAGRFLYAPRPGEGSDVVVLDFNRAYNPPCAFTPYATCPLPPPGNALPLAIEAGEKDYGR